MKVRTKKGYLSAYGLACGYVEKKKNNVLHKQHGLYVVDNQETLQRAFFYKLKEAQKHFNNL